MSIESDQMLNRGNRRIETSPPSDSRASLLRRYLAESKVVARPELGICTPGTVGTAVIPALNEVHGITTTLKTIENAGGLEAIVVDNGSRDGTQDIVREFARRSSMPVALIDCLQPGYGPTRKTGLDQVVANYLAQDPNAANPRHIVIMDADALLVPEWIGHHRRIIADLDMGAIGVTYRFPESVDQQIQAASGIPNYLYSLARLANRLTAEGVAKTQTGTKGSVIEVGAYAAIGGAKLVAQDVAGVSAEDRVMGDMVREKGMKVGFNPALNIHDARRVIFELTNKIAALQTYDVDPTEFRARQLAASNGNLEEAMQRLTTGEWLTYHRQRLESFVHRNVVAPIANRQIVATPLYNLLARNNVQPSLGGNVKGLTDFFIQQDNLLSSVYSRQGT